MITEQEAKTKWCPYSRVIQWVGGPDGELVGATSGNRATAMDDECACIASECMAWRGEETLSTNERIGRGYCGLAGPPWINPPVMTQSDEDIPLIHHPVLRGRR